VQQATPCAAAPGCGTAIPPGCCGGVRASGRVWCQPCRPADARPCGPTFAAGLKNIHATGPRPMAARPTVNPIASFALPRAGRGGMRSDCPLASEICSALQARPRPEGNRHAARGALGGCKRGGAGEPRCPRHRVSSCDPQHDPEGGGQVQGSLHSCVSCRATPCWA
jgi:hypothetical protein